MLKFVTFIGLVIVGVLCMGSSASAAEQNLSGFAKGSNGYWAVWSGAQVQSRGNLDSGPQNGMALNAPIVGMAAKPSGDGYWMVARDGGVFSYNAAFHGSMGGKALNKPIVGIASTPSGGGYWLVASDGGVFSFGDASFHGSMGGKALNRPVVGMASTASGNGYWLVASDGGVFSFGDASFKGSTGSIKLNKPIIGMHRAGDGYRMVASDGGVFSYGAGFFGSTGSLNLRGAITGQFGSEGGYAFIGGDGGVFTFGNEANYGRFDGIAPGVTLRPGDSGTMVKEMQLTLEDKKVWVGSTGGSYDYLTTQAVTALQKLHALGRTGVADPAIIGKMYATNGAPLRGGSADRLEVDISRQLLYFVKGGQLQWVINTSTGAASTPTDKGVYNVFRTVNAWDPGPNGSLYRPRYFNRGEAVHGLGSVPPYPASHGCARVSLPAMDFIWNANLMPVGLQVSVY